MADTESNININIDASDAMAALKELQRQISVFNQQMQKSSAQNAAAAANLRNNLINNINATGKFEARITTIKTTTEAFTEALEKNKLSMGQYFRYAGGATKTFGKLFKKEFDTIEQVARDRVKTLQTQYIKLGRDANGAMRAISVKPLMLDMKNLGTQTAIAAQKQALLNQLLKQGSTQLLNFGKNTQWAGRQLMVGFTVPLTMLGTTASKSFMEMEKAVIKFKRVYGDLGTTMSDTDKMVQRVELLAKTFTRYGVAVKDTMEMAADAAAMGKTGADLIAQITEASRLAVLGQVEQQQALETTMSLTNAFGTAAEDLAKKINFLNSVENQTATSIEDLTIAIPKAAPVIKQLGGDVEDLAFFLTAMKEGGINASEGANALKSGLASLINPTNKASEFLRGFGINVKGIVEANRGDVNGLVIDFAKALDKLDPLNRARAIEQMFGKFQFSRLSTLFQNVIKDGSQAQKVLEMTRATSEELAVLADRELKRVEDSPAFKFQKAMEDLKVALVPLGKAFLKAVTPLVEFATKILDQFNNLSDGAKSFVTNIVGIVGVIGPALLMGFGLVANGVANLIKLFTSIKTAFNNAGQSSTDVASQTEYMTQAQMEAAAVAASLDQTHTNLTQTLTAEATAIDQLRAAYERAVEAQKAFNITSPAPVSSSTTDEPNAQGYAKGTMRVPGPKGAGDIVPALLSPGEAVIPAKNAQKYAPIISGIISGNLPGFNKGTTGVGLMRQTTYGPLTQAQTEGMQRTGQQLEKISAEVYAGPYGKVAPTDYGTQVSPTTGHSFPAFGVGGVYQKPDGTMVFVKPQMNLTSAMAEMRGTQIARGAHGLQSPEQKIGVMVDPTDPTGKRRFIVLESAVDPKFANAPASFTKDQYIKQLVASLLRGDKDLGLGNLGGDILADVGTAGVFQRASGERALGEKINSMEEQAIINLLGVKGGAKRFFAEATSDIAKQMTPAEYDAAIKAEIQSVIPRLDATIAGFGNLTPEEQVAYADMQERLRSGLNVDWGKYQVMHSSVPPKKFRYGGWGDPRLNIPPYKSEAQKRKEEEARQRAAEIAASPEGQARLKAQRAAMKAMASHVFLYDPKVAGPLTEDSPIVARMIEDQNKGELIFAYDGGPIKFTTEEMYRMLRRKGMGAGNYRVVPSSNTEALGELYNVNVYGSKGGIVRRYEDGTPDAGQNFTSQQIRELLKIQETHMFGELDPTDPNIAAQLQAKYPESKPEDYSKFKVLTNLTMSLPGKLNQAIKETTNGLPGDIFSKVYNSLRGKLSKTAKMAGVKDLAAAQQLEDIIGTKFSNIPIVKDGIFAQQVESTIGEYLNQNNSIGGAANLIWERTKQVGTVRPKREEEGKWNEIISGMLQRNELVIEAGSENAFPEAKTPFGGRFGRINADDIGTSKTEEGRALRAKAHQAARQWALAGNSKAPLPFVTDSSGNSRQLKWRDNSEKPGLFSTENFEAYDSKAKGFESELSFAPGGYSVLQGLGYFSNGGMIPGYADGVFSVPGPKGAGDIIPALLSPGEAVIPADKAAQNRGLISQMITGKLPGYKFGDDNVGDAPGSMPPSIPGVSAPEPYMAQESKASSFFGKMKDSVAGALDKAGEKLKEKAKQAGDVLIEKAKDVGETAMLQVAKSINVGGNPLVDRKGVVRNQDQVDQFEAQAAAEKLRDEMLTQQNISAQKYLEATDMEYARLAEERKAYQLKQLGLDTSAEITEQEKQAAIERNALMAQREEALTAELNANTAESQALRQRIKESGIAEEDINALTQEIPNVSGTGGTGTGGKEQKTIGSRIKSLHGILNKAGGVALGANSIAAMMPGEIGKKAQEMMIPIMSIASALPMLSSPLGILTVVVTGAITAWATLDGAFKKGADTMIDLYEAIGSGTAAMRKFAEFTGKATAGEVMDKRREGKLNPFQIVPGKKTFGESFMESEQGKALAKSYGAFLKTGATTKQGREQMVNQLSTAVASGAMTAAQARSVAVNLGKELKDYSFAVDVNASVAELVGPNGENLAKNPLEVRAKLIAQSVEKVNEASANLNKQGGMNLEEMGQVSGGAAIGLAGGAIAGLVAAPALLGMLGVAVAAGPVGWVAAAGAVIGAVVVGAMSAASYAERLGKLAGANVALQKQALEQSQEMIDSLDLEYEKRIETAKLAGDMAKAEALTNEHLAARGKLLSEQEKLNRSIVQNFENSPYKEQLKEGARKVVAKKYKDTVFEDIAPIAQQNIYDSAATDAQEQQLMLAMSTDLDPTMVLQLLEMFGKDQKELTRILDVQLKYGSAFTGELTGIAALFVDTQGNPVKSLQTNLVAKVTAAGTYEQAQEILDTYAAITRTSDTLQVDVIVDTVMKNPAIEAKLGKLIDFISEQKGKINFDIVADTKILDAKSLAILKEDMEFFNNIKTKEQQQAYLFTLITSVNAITDVNDPAVQAWLGDAGIKFKQSPPGEQLAQYAIWNARRFADISADFTKEIGGDSGAGTPDTSWLDEFNKRIRDVLNWTHKMTQGFVQSKKAIEQFAKTGMNMFDGLEMKLKRAGATDELTGAILGLSKEDYDKYKSRLIDAKGNLTSFAKTLIKVTNQLAFGDAIVENDKIVLQARTMSQAFSGAKNGMQSFIDNGVIPAADAYEILKNATVASAFAADKEGKSRKALVKSYLMAKKAQWLMMSADEKRQKTTEMYNANLDIISQQEEEINKKYDERNKALDKIQTANEAITKQNQVQASLAEAFAKGDLSAAVRAAKEMEALAASQAIEARRAAMEEARQKELDNISVDINGVLMTRKDIEDQIAAANKLTAESKAAQLEKEVAIGLEAEANRKAVLAWMASKDNPASKNYKPIGGPGGPSSGPSTTDSTDDTKDTTPISASKIIKDIKASNSIGGFAATGLAQQAQGIISGKTQATAKSSAQSKMTSSKDSISGMIAYLNGGNSVKEAIDRDIAINGRISNTTFDQIATLRTQLDGTKRGELDKYISSYKSAIKEFDAASVSADAFKATKTAEIVKLLPKPIQDAFKQLASFKDTFLLNQKAVNDARKEETRQRTLAGDEGSWQESDRTAVQGAVDAKNKAQAAFSKFQKDNIDPIWSQLSAKGYPLNLRKLIAGYADGGMVMPSYMSLGGFAMGTDTVPAMLTPGEFIVSQPAVEEFGLGNLKAINSGTYGGNSVYNYSVNVNAGSNASADDIARAVMNKINEVDARRVRGNNF